MRYIFLYRRLRYAVYAAVTTQAGEFYIQTASDAARNARAVL